MFATIESSERASCSQGCMSCTIASIPINTTNIVLS